MSKNFIHFLSRKPEATVAGDTATPENLTNHIMLRVLRHKTALRCAAVLIAITLTSCEMLGELPSETVSVSGSDGVGEIAPFPVEVGGVRFEESPQKVVCLSPSLAEILFETGYGGRIIGRGRYCDYPPLLQTVPDAGSSANADISAIEDLAPDLVLTATPLSSMDVTRLSQKGIKTLCVPAPKNLSEFSDIYKAVGLVFEGKFDYEKTAVAFLPISKFFDNKDVVNFGNFVYITEGYSVAGGDTFESSCLSCFGNNVAKEAVGYVTDKGFLAENPPDLILVNSRYAKSDLDADETLASLEAFKKGRIVYLDAACFEKPSARIIVSVQKAQDVYRTL